MISSIYPYQGPDGTKYVLWWQDVPGFVPPATPTNPAAVPMAMNLLNGVVYSPTIDPASSDTPIASTARWNYALGRSGYLYATNGTDKKFFDGGTWRNLGLPALTDADVAGVTISAGPAGLSQAQIDAVTLAIGGFDQVYMIPPVGSGLPNTQCVDLKFVVNPGGWHGSFGYYNPSDTGNTIGAPGYLPTPAQSTTGDTLMFNAVNQSTTPMLMGVRDALGAPLADVAPWLGMPSSNFAMTVSFTLVVGKEGTHDFLIAQNDGMFFGVDGSATLYKGPGPNNDGFNHQMTAVNGYPVIAANNIAPPHGNFAAVWTVYFPAAGNYNFEIDFANGAPGSRLTVLADNQDVLNVIPPTLTGSTADTVGRDVYCVLFDEAADVSKDPNQALSPATFLGRVLFATGSNLLVTGLPDFTGSVPSDPPPAVPKQYLDKLIAMTGDGDVTARFVANRNVATLTEISGPAGASVIKCSGVKAQPGDIVGICGTGDPLLDGFIFQVQGMPPDVDHFTIISPPGVSGTVTPNFTSGTVSVLAKAALNETAMPPIQNLFFMPCRTVDTTGDIGIAGSTVGGAQPGYQFYASIINTTTHHIGNRVKLNGRIAPTGRAAITISGLPPVTTQNPEWQLLIGRTGDGGEVPYAIMDSQGNWLTVPSPTVSGSTSVKIVDTQIDGAAELPINNDEPPAFDLLWREGDRICGVKLAAGLYSTVWRSGSEQDAMTGDFMGDPGQAWSPSKIETFPTAEAIVGGFGYDGSSWVYTANDFAELSELTGETLWNGPWNTGIAGPHAFTRGWKNLPYWVSHDKQLCCMISSMSATYQAMTEATPISGEYEAALLSKIGDAYMQETELLYFRDPLKQVDILRIKCRDVNGNPFCVIHDFNIRDQRSQMGQGYEEGFAGPLALNYTHEVIRDKDGHLRIWAGDANNLLYQLYTGGNDNGAEFTADAMTLAYVGPNRTTVQFIDFYGDEKVEWFVADELTAVPDPLEMQELSQYVQPVPGQENDSHWQISLDRPEMVHAYIWFRLTSHSVDGTTDLNPVPHMPMETYGRVLMISPLLGESSGR